MLILTSSAGGGKTSTLSYTPWEEAGEKKEERGAPTFYKSCRHSVWFPRAFQGCQVGCTFLPVPATPGQLPTHQTPPQLCSSGSTRGPIVHHESHGGDESLQLPRSWYCEHCVWGGIFGRVEGGQGLSLQELCLGPFSHQLAIESEFNKLF